METVLYIVVLELLWRLCCSIGTVVETVVHCSIGTVWRLCSTL